MKLDPGSEQSKEVCAHAYISIRKCVLMSFKGAAFLLRLKPQASMWTIPEGPVGWVSGSWWSWKPVLRRRGQGPPAGAALTLPLSEQSGEVSLGFVQLPRVGSRITRTNLPGRPGGRQRPSEACALGSARPLGPRARRRMSTPRSGARASGHASTERTLRLILAHLVEQLGAKALGISHRSLPVEPVNILCGRFSLSKLPENR